MLNFRAVLPFAAVFVCTSLILGCSGKSATTITLNPSSTATINQGQTQNITATVANDKTNQGVTWSLGTSVGTLTNVTKTSVTYVAPSVVSSSTTATVTATSVASTAATASLTITVNSVLAIATTSLPVGTQNSPYFGVISATGATGTFTWTLTSGTLPAGLTLGSSTSSSVTISGTPTATGTSTVTIQVTSGSSTVSQALSITINPPPPLSVATKSLPNGFVGTPYSSSLSAASGTSPYTWSLVGSPPSGLAWLNLNPDGTITGTPTQQGAFQFTVQVVDSSSPTQTATGTVSITINPANAFNSQLKGTYAFLVSGFGATGQYAIAGSLVADGNGGITSGVIDDPINALQGSPLSSPSLDTYQINSNGLGTISFTPSQGGERVFQLALLPAGAGGVSTGGKLLECDNGASCGTSGSGVLLQQDSNAFFTSQILGNYAFGFLGSDGTGARYALAGSFNSDGQGNVNNGLTDSDDAGVLLATSFTSSAFGSIDASTGRTTLTITPSGQPNINLAIYVVSATELLTIQTDKLTGASNPLVSGMILQQSATTLTAPGVFETTAANSVTPLEPVAQVGVLTPSSGNMSTSFDKATAGAITTVSGPGGPYTIGSGGRTTLSGSGLQTTGDPILYLVSDSAGFIVGTDTGVTFGFMEAQNGTGSFSNSSLSGSYAGGSVPPVISTSTNQVDIATPNSAFTVLTFNSESASVGGGLIQSQTSPTYSIDLSGRGTTTGPATVFYMVSGSEFWLLYPNATVERFQQ